MRRITKDADYMRRRRENLGKKGFCTTCFLEKRIKNRKSCFKCLTHDRKRIRETVIKIRREVLAHYGKKHKLLCRARGCDVSNLWMLSLDHIKDNGQSKPFGYRGGWMLYRRLKVKGYPSGFQTLCANHQMLKEFKRRERNRK